MGSIITNPVHDFIVEQKPHIKQVVEEKLESVQTDMMKRQWNLQNMIRETQMATNIARARDNWYWMFAFYSTVATMATANFIKKRSTVGFIPLVPLTFLLAFNYDFAFGNKMTRVRSEAESILETERHGLLLLAHHPEKEIILPFLEYDNSSFEIVKIEPER